jgi:hypothetical protein
MVPTVRWFVGGCEESLCLCVGGHCIIVKLIHYTVAGMFEAYNRLCMLLQTEMTEAIEPVYQKQVCCPTMHRYL